jgi:hypothetical protein
MLLKYGNRRFKTAIPVKSAIGARFGPINQPTNTRFLYLFLIPFSFKIARLPDTVHHGKGMIRQYPGYPFFYGFFTRILSQGWPVLRSGAFFLFHHACHANHNKGVRHF